MPAKPLALEGFIEEPTTADDPNEWRRYRQKLEDDVRSLRREVEDLTADKQRLSRSIENLRRILGPIHNGLRALFGEIELAVGEEVAVPPIASTIQPGTTDPRWENYKRQFGTTAGEIIDALLVHGAMTGKQLATLTHHDYRTIWGAADKLRKAGALVNDGDGWSLRR